MKKVFDSQTITLFIVAAVAAFLPLVLKGNQYAMVLVTTVLIYAVLASAWNIIGGYAGQMDLSAGAYLGLGAFTTGTLLLKFNLTPWVGMFIGGLIAMGISALIGLPFFRFKIKELWYALSSSAMVEVFRVIFMLWGDVGGPTERYLPIGNTPAENWYNMRFYTYAPYFYIMLVLLIIVMLVSKYIRISKLGYSLLALGEDEDAAEVLGVNARKSKLTALMIYAFFGGLVGGVYACMYGFIHPSYFSIPMSTEVAILGIVGGLGLTYGPLFAAVLMVSLREYLRSSLGGGMEGVYLVVYSLILILVALFQPRGLYPLFQKLLDKVKQFIGRRDDARSTASKN